MSAKDDLHQFQSSYGPWAIVAGASRGLGAEFAEQLAQKGLNLVLAARSLQPLSALAAKLEETYSIQVLPLQLDLADESAAQSLNQAVLSLDVGLLVYNAAYSATGPFFKEPLEGHLKELNTNCRTPLALVYLLGERMLSRGRGGIILMSSLSAVQGSAYVANYAATKAYERILAEGLWEELRAQGIQVIASSPGAVSTPNYEQSLEGGGQKPPASATSPETVARETIQALGKGPGVVPGRGYRLASFMMDRVLPRSMAIRLMGRVLRNMYAGDK